jgi:hypothetical protein
LKPLEVLAERLRVPIFDATALDGLRRALVEQQTAFVRAISTSRIDWTRLQRLSDRAESVERAGWLPHRTSPFDLTMEAPDAAAADIVIAEHYATEWPAIREAFSAQVESLTNDTETLAVFEEALSAQGAGLFRVAPRLLFPEFERIARAEFAPERLGGMASLRDLRDAAGGLTPGEMDEPGLFSLAWFRKLDQHLYSRVETPDELARVAGDPVPNRHAALHGLVPYATAKTSINALIMATYVFGVIHAVRKRLDVTAP